jgi:hypothetical protein
MARCRIDGTLDNMLKPPLCTVQHSPTSSCCFPLPAAKSRRLVDEGISLGSVSHGLPGSRSRVAHSERLRRHCSYQGRRAHAHVAVPVKAPPQLRVTPVTFHLVDTIGPRSMSSRSSLWRAGRQNVHGPYRSLMAVRLHLVWSAHDRGGQCHGRCSVGLRIVDVG